MSATNKTRDINDERKNTPSAYFAAKSLEDGADEDSACYGLHASHTSTISNDSELSLSLDNELIGYSNAIDVDELPVFEIRLVSPLGRTPSPIDNEDMDTPTRQAKERLIHNLCHNNPEFVALHDINAQISPPSDHGNEDDSLSGSGNLETIYEGVFLNTPPRQRLSLQNRNMRRRSSLLEKVTHNRINVGKENQSPSPKCITTQLLPERLDPAYETNNFYIDKKHNFT